MSIIPFGLFLSSIRIQFQHRIIVLKAFTASLYQTSYLFKILKHFLLLFYFSLTQDDITEWVTVWVIVKVPVAVWKFQTLEYHMKHALSCSKIQHDQVINHFYLTRNIFIAWWRLSGRFLIVLTLILGYLICLTVCSISSL